MISNMFHLYQTGQYERIQYMYFCGHFITQLKEKTLHKVDELITNETVSITNPAYCQVADDIMQKANLRGIRTRLQIVDESEVFNTLSTYPFFRRTN